ncbi:hypothetical protein niasHT_006151 [Heterodera trifolii]|uniref:Uncharacterized protein n=1 Tax=Heterodera trifolii TaxID=157864 RepID=A0ABD2M4G5_9BILA
MFSVHSDNPNLCYKWTCAPGAGTNDQNAVFLRAARAGNIDQVLEFMHGGIDYRSLHELYRDKELIGFLYQEYLHGQDANEDIHPYKFSIVFLFEFGSLVRNWQKWMLYS